MGLIEDVGWKYSYQHLEAGVVSSRFVLIKIIIPINEVQMKIQNTFNASANAIQLWIQ